MPTIVNRIVAYAGYSGQTDATLAAAFTAIPADIRAGTGTDEQWNIYIGPSAAGVNEWNLGGYGPTLSGKSTNSTNYITISALAGLSFKDNANKLTAALTYNAANGIALKASNIVLTSNVAFTRIENLQFLRTATTAFTGENAVTVTGASSRVTGCIFKSDATNRATLRVSGSSSFVSNTLLLTAGDALATEFAVRVSNTTIVRTSGAGGFALSSSYGPPTVKNLAAFGFSTLIAGGDTSYNAASSNNATDLSSGPTNWGSGSLVNRTFANQFENITGAGDFRVKAGADLIGAGVREQTYTNDVDVVGSARSTGTAPSGPTIGAWEYPLITYTYARPTSDITTQWSTSSGTTHYTLIDEAVADDNDYIVATAAGQTDEVKLAAMTPPQVATNLVINYKVTGIDGGATVTVSLRQGSAGTLIKTDTAKSANGTYALTVAPADWAAVTDWSDLRLRFVSA